MKKPPDRGGAGPVTAEDVLLVYESLLAATQSMLGLAREGAWDALLDGESDYLVEVEALARMEAAVKLDESQQARKAELLEGVLHNDLQIRKLLINRRDELGEKISVNQRKRDLNRAYRPVKDPVTKLDDS